MSGSVQDEYGQTAMACYASPCHNYYEPSDLRLRAPIFLSHSGRDKDFVSFLDQALCNCGYRVFYDKESLPEAIPVSMENILQVATKCTLGVLVLSDNFFEDSCNPMLELAALVDHKVDLLPLFYGLSVEEFKDESRRNKWYKKWRTWVSEDIITHWQATLNTIRTIHGIEYCKEARNSKKYIEIVVSKVCRVLRFDLSHIDGPFQGRERLCKFVAEMYEEVERRQHLESQELEREENLKSMDKVAGVYGIGGMGKSTLCRALCDYFYSEFESRVCHIELGSDGGPLPCLKKLLSCFNNHCCRAQLDEDPAKVWNLLRETMDCCEPIFLCIDNVVEETEDEAEKYLRCGPYPKGSKIFLTARSLPFLQKLTRDDNSCVLKEVPVLDFHEAKNVFLHNMSPSLSLLHEDADLVVNQCVKLCTLNRGSDDFHPLTLMSFATYLPSRTRSTDPLKWKGVVAELSLDRSIGLGKVFKFLDLIYRDLSKKEKLVFFDLAFYNNHHSDAKRWLHGFYDHLAHILFKLETLSLIQINKDGCHMHDTIKEFAKQKVNNESAVSNLFFLENSEVQCNSTMLNDCRHCRKVAFSSCVFRPNSTLDLSKFDGIEVLHLMHNHGIENLILSEAELSKLHSLVVLPAPRTCSTGLPASMLTTLVETSADWWWMKKQEESDNHLRWIHVEDCKVMRERRTRSRMRALFHRPDQLIECDPFRGLLSLRMKNVQGLTLANLGEFKLLEELSLDHVAVKTGFINCPRLRVLSLSGLSGVEYVRGLERSLGIQSVTIQSCKKLVSLSILDKNIHLCIEYCPYLERIDMHPRLEAQDLKLVTGEECQGLPCWSLWDCGNLEHINGLVRRESLVPVHCLSRTGKPLRKTACDLVKQAGIDSSVCRVNIRSFKLQGGIPGFASLSDITLEDAQHVSSFILALHVANVRNLKVLKILCTTEEPVGCGCDVDPPSFTFFSGCLEVLLYNCPQVRDLSCLGQLTKIKYLDLCGCRSAEGWPEFVDNSSLRSVFYNLKPLKEYPAIFTQRYAFKESEPLTSVPPRITKADYKALRHDLKYRIRDWHSIAEAIGSYAPQLISVLVDGSSGRRYLSKLLYALISSEAECFTRFKYGFPAMGCQETQIMGCLEPLLAVKEVATAFLRAFLAVPSSERWTVSRRELVKIESESFFVLKRPHCGVEQLELVLVGLVSIKRFNIPVTEGLTNMMAEIAQSFASREDHSLQGEYLTLENRSKHMMYYYKMLALRVKDAVCRMASVPTVAAKLGESFMTSHIYPLQDGITQEYASYRDGSLYENMEFWHHPTAAERGWH